MARETTPGRDSSETRIRSRRGLEDCDWLSSPLRQFETLPGNGKPIEAWGNDRAAYFEIASGLRRLAQSAQSLGRRDVDAPIAINIRVRHRPEDNKSGLRREEKFPCGNFGIKEKRRRRSDCLLFEEMVPEVGVEPTRF